MKQSVVTATVGPIRLLLIDDDTKFCRLIGDYLGRYGYEVHPVHSGTDGLQRALEETWSAVVLDVMLPGIDGFEVLRKLREQQETPVLMLTALGEETDRIVGLEIGADDYLRQSTSSPRASCYPACVPCSGARRGRLCRPDGIQPEIVVGGLTINVGARVATVDGEELLLTPVEFELLVVLAQARGRVKSREELINEIRDRNYEV